MNKVTLLLIGTVVLIGLYSLNTYNTPQQITDLNNDSILENYHYVSSKELNIAVIGDYGWGNVAQEEVAKKLNEIAGQEEFDFILGVGDNFYEPDGVTGLNDSNWNTKWADVYPRKSHLQGLNWFGTLGNHDYEGTGMTSEFEYDEYGWKIDDFFWTHTAEVDGKKVAFIHIDTNYLAYGKDGSDSQPLMKDWFKKLGWKDYDQMLGYIEEQLIQYESYDWKIVMGHHPIGYSCPKKKKTNRIVPLLEQYKVDAYLSGHKHTLSYDQSETMAYILSGAAGDDDFDKCGDEGDPIWSKGYIYGFISFKLTKDHIYPTAHYVESSDTTFTNWKVKELEPYEKYYQ